MNNNILFSIIIIIINIWMVCVLKYLYKLLKILLFSQDLRFEIFK